MEIASADLAPIRDLYGRGLYLQALQKTSAFGPIREWTSTASRLLAGRLVIQLGAPRLGRWLHLRAYRNTPTHHEAIYYHARYRLERFGPLAAWRFLRGNAEWNDAPPEVRADWYGLHGFVAARLRDFDRAERFLNRAESLVHDRAWLCIERAAAYEFAERYDDALHAARRSQELNPWFRPGIQAEAHLLELLGREKEAIQRLGEASQHIESGIIVAHLAGIQINLGHYYDARQNYDRYAELSPLMEPETAHWLAARRSDVTFFLGDRVASLHWAKEAAEPVIRRKMPLDPPRPDDEFYRDFAARLQASEQVVPPPSIVRLDRGRLPDKAFSLFEGLAGFWDVRPSAPPVEGVTFDGLPDPRERRWAEANGFHAVEFAVTAEAALSLLERGIPFLLTLVDAGYSHSQLVVGLDPLRGTFWIRDPNERRSHESPFTPLLKRYASLGPRGLAVVPKAEAHRLDGLVLPESKAYDTLHRLQSALLDYDRPAAAAIYETMKETAPEQRITRSARIALARFDSNPTLLLQAIEAMLAVDPDDTNFLLTKINTLRDLGRKEERLALAKSQVDRPDGDPLFAQHYVQLLLPDPRFHVEAARVMRNGVRRRSYAAPGYYILANVLWELREFHDAADLYRFAASLDERDEQFAEGYFRAARVIEQTPEAMRFLQMRYNRTKGKLAAPARALFYALSEQDEMSSAFSILEQAASLDTKRPTGDSAEDAGTRTEQADEASAKAIEREQGEVMLFLAEMRANYNEPESGKHWLDAALTKAERTSWLRAAGRIALLQSNLPEARRCWEEILSADPLSLEAHRNLARILADLEGKEGAIAWVRNLCERFTHFHPLQQLLIDWLRGEPSPSPSGDETTDVPAIPVIRRLIEQCPEDAWARRELALHLANHGRPLEAFPELEIARRLDPENPSYFYTFGHVCHKADQVAEAKAAYEDAIRRSVDNEVAISELVSLARGDEEKKEVLQFVADEFKEQPIFGDGLLTFRDQAVNILEPDDLLRILQHLLDEHNELWQCWSTTVQQLVISQRLEEAHELAKEAVARFPLLARLWVDLAEVRRDQGEAEGQIEALRQAVAVAPGWNFAARELAEALEADQRGEEASVILEQAVARSPLDPVNHGYLADNLWNANEGKDALARLKIGLRMDPGYDWAWRALGNWSERVEPPEDSIDTAREVAQLRPGDPRAWLALVRLLQGAQYHQEALDALDKAIRLNPRSIEGYDLKAERLAEMGRFDEAKSTAMPTVFENDPPMVLQGRAAWVEARRGRLDVACREMRALVTLEPNYYWGWQQLAEWYNETGKSQEYLEAAEKLTELRPDSPVALAMRGEAKLRNEDREGGKDDLREAQKIAPDYSFAGMLLFDAYLEDEEFDNARTALSVLQEHIGDSGRPYVAARHVQLAVREEDQDAALNAIRDACTLPCDSTWPINTAVNECRGAGWGSEADAVLREILEEEPEFHPYTLFVWLDGPDGQKSDPELRLKIVSRVIEVHPRDVRPHDVRAEMLTRLQRYDEAVAACKPTAFGDHPPLILRGRAAWVLAQRGDRTGAVAQMREILKTDPDYYWGWQQIANWYDAADAHPEYLESAENLVRLAPNDPAAFGYRGEAKLFGGDRRGAKADFQKAFELDPNYAFAGLHLVDEQLADAELDEAAGTVARLQQHIGGPYVALRAVRLAVRQKDQAEASKQFREMCTESESTYLLLNKAADTLGEAGWIGDLEEVLSEVVEDEDVSPHVGRLWAERCAAKTVEGFDAKLQVLLDNGEIGKEALYASVEALATPALRARLHQCIRQYGDLLKETDRGWAKTADALTRIGDFTVAATWVGDWGKRETPQPWMLHAAALTFRMLDRTDEAYAVSKKAVALDESDPSLSDHEVWLALEDALAGRTEEASELLRELDKDELDDLPQLFFAFAESMVLVQMASTGNRAAAFAEAVAKVEEAMAALAPKEPNADLKRTYLRWVSRIAKDAGGLKAWWWATRKRWRGGI